MTMEKAMAPHSRTLAWKIPWTEEPGRLQSMGSLRVRHDFTFTFMHWRRKWQPTPVFLPGESQGRESLVGCRLWRRTESDTSEALCWRRVRGLWKHPDGRDWLRGKLGLDLMGGVMLSKSLIQFSVEWSCVPSLLFTWSQTMVTSLVAQMVRHLPTMQET